MRLNPELVNVTRTTAPPGSEFGATLNAHGLYNSFQFVLRLSPRVHREISGITAGIVSSADVTFDQVQAFSTYLHETVHWWQHIGSTHGLLRSLVYPIQTHRNHGPLKKLLKRIGLRKSLRRVAEHLPGICEPGTVAGITNAIVNNHFDFAAFLGLTHDRRMASSIIQAPMFESVGHAFWMTYANATLALAETLDPDFRALPDPRTWGESFRSLRESEREGFYRGSPVGLWPVGALEIFEGQARFCQLQYFAFVSGGRLGWSDFGELGMLHGVYTRAFDCFLRLTQIARPSAVDHPTVALFLLVCDMAINPGSGFPHNPEPHFPTFIVDTDPGARFAMLCRLICQKCPHIASAIREYSRSEYEQVTEELGAVLRVDSPLSIAATCTRWAAKSGPLEGLMREYLTFDYEPTNLPVRVLFSHFLAVMRDRLDAPEFFCWPGAWMAGERVSPRAEGLFDRHGALFLDKEDDDGVFPRVCRGSDQVVVQRTFNAFYGANVVYDLTDQWIARAGPFKYDYRWLAQRASRDEMSEFARREFSSAYGVDPSEAVVL